MRTLGIDVGGTRLKAAVLDHLDQVVAGPARVDTPHPSSPVAVVDALCGIVSGLGEFDRISVGFPGVVRNHRVITAPNLGTPQWRDFPLGDELTARLHRPVRVLNDASVQGLGVIAGRGLECVITLGTGIGFALFDEGRLAPHLELGQHIARKRRTYDEYVGNAALQRVGMGRWRRRVVRVIAAIDTLTNFDALLIGGGNAKHLAHELPPRVRTVENLAGITGGTALWSAKLDPVFAERSA